MKEYIKNIAITFFMGFAIGIGALVLGVLISLFLHLSTRAIMETLPTYIAEAFLIGSVFVFYDLFVLEN